MILDKFDRCYKEGIKIGFVQLSRIDENGKKYYHKCPGNEDTPGKTNKECLNCFYLNKNYSNERMKLAEQIEFNHRLRERGILDKI